jgi:hypothetical protein
MIKTHFIIRIVIYVWIVFQGFSLYAQDLTHFSKNKSSVSGSISSEGSYYGSDGGVIRREPFAGSISGNFTVNIKGIILPFSFIISNKQRSFRQPFNEFGLSPTYKSVKMHLGYRSVDFSKYVMGNHRFFGAGVEWKPGNFRFGFIYGNLKKATNTAVKIYEPENDTMMDYRRRVISVKLGYGRQDRYVDFIFMRASDDTTSVTAPYASMEVYPQANVAAGIRAKWRLSSKAEVETEAAYSIFTPDISASGTPENTASVGVIPENGTTHGALAVESRFNYRINSKIRVGLHYRRLGAGYQSLGTYFINNDVENIRVESSLSLLKNKLNISLSGGVEHNNLDGRQDATTYKTIGFINLGYQAGKNFGINLSYTNFNVNQEPGRIQIADSVKLYQSNGNFYVAPYYTFVSKNKKMSHYAGLNISYMQLTDLNPQSHFSNAFSTWNRMFVYNLNLLKSGWSFSLNLLSTSVLMKTGNSFNNGLGLGINKNLKKPSLSAGFNLQVMKSVTGNDSSMIWTPSVHAGYKISKHHKLQFNFNVIMKNRTINGMSVEQFGKLRYTYQL